MSAKANKFASLSADTLAQMQKWSQGSGLPKVLQFYSQRDLPSGVFSNFFPAPITVKGTQYPTSEHYFQALKFFPHSMADVNDAIAALTPGDTAAVGRDRCRPLRPDWELSKIDIMYDALAAKFLQDSNLFACLLMTGESILVEHTKNDRCWGNGGRGRGFSLGDADSNGDNHLGRLLMKLRGAVRAQVPDAGARAHMAAMIREAGINPLRDGGAEMLFPHRRPAAATAVVGGAPAPAPAADDGRKVQSAAALGGSSAAGFVEQPAPSVSAAAGRRPQHQQPQPQPQQAKAARQQPQQQQQQIHRQRGRGSDDDDGSDYGDGRGAAGFGDDGDVPAQAVQKRKGKKRLQ